jgi:hypothetical protein
MVYSQVDASKQEAAAALALLDRERGRMSALESEVRRQFDAHCKAFEARMRVKASKSIAAWRQHNGVYVPYLVSLVSLHMLRWVLLLCGRVFTACCALCCDGAPTLSCRDAIADAPTRMLLTAGPKSSSRVDGVGSSVPSPAPPAAVTAVDTPAATDGVYMATPLTPRRYPEGGAAGVSARVRSPSLLPPFTSAFLHQKRHSVAVEGASSSLAGVVVCSCGSSPLPL